MSKTKQIVLTVLIFSIGIGIINTYLFSEAGMACFCDSRSQAEYECSQWCPSSSGGCLHIDLTYSECDGDLCHAFWKFYCENGTIGYWDALQGCHECGEN